MELTQEICHQLFIYDDGKLINKVNRGNLAKKGSIAGCLHKRKNTKNKEYFVVKINKKVYLQHRLIFLMFYGYLPEYPDQVDHIDGNSLNNRIENLRKVTASQNSQNRKIIGKNKSGASNVVIHKQSGKWQASIYIDKKIKYLGLFENLNDAITARKKAENKYYGEFAFKGD